MVRADFRGSGILIDFCPSPRRPTGLLLRHAQGPRPVKRAVRGQITSCPEEVAALMESRWSGRSASCVGRYADSGGLQARLRVSAGFALRRAQIDFRWAVNRPQNGPHLLFIADDELSLSCSDEPGGYRHAVGASAAQIPSLKHVMGSTYKSSMTHQPAYAENFISQQGDEPAPRTPIPDSEIWIGNVRLLATQQFPAVSSR